MLRGNKEIRAVMAGAVLVIGFLISVLASGEVDLGDFANLVSNYLGAAFSLWAIVGAVMLVVALILNLPKDKDSPGPVTLMANLLTERWHRDYFISMIWPPVLFSALMAGFNTFKQMILAKHGFRFDPLFADIDRAMFFGHDPWTITHAIFGSPLATTILDHSYHGWYAPMALGVIVCAWLPADSWRLRTQYLLTYIGIWLGLGSIFASLTPSAGPVYYPLLVGPQESFTAMIAQLNSIDKVYELRALDLQALLLSTLGSTELTPGAGISAMPSVHNALAVLFAIAAFKINRIFGWVMAVYAFIIWIGSIHLGWHYAIDGLVSLVLTLGLWKAFGAMTIWLETSPSVHDPVPLQDEPPLSAEANLEASQPLQWWQTGWFIAAASLASAIPFLYPTVPPLVDVSAHVGRYAVQLGLAGPNANLWYDFEWALIGNLGIDLLIIPMAPIFGLELGAKIIIMFIPVLQVAGFLLAAREVHGRIPPTALFALPLAYSFPLHFGFINFMLAAAFCFLALALWVRLGKQGRLRLRFWIFVPISLVLWITHTFGLGMFGILAFFAEVSRNRQEGRTWLQSAWGSVLQCIGLTVPFVPLFLSRAGGGIEVLNWFNWSLKLNWAEMVLRDRWQFFDHVSLLVLVAVIFASAVWRRSRFTLGLSFAALFFFFLFLVMPYIIFGSAYADMRLVPFALACVILSIGFSSAVSPKVKNGIALAAVAFFMMRLAGTTYSFALIHQDHTRIIAALDYVPEKSRMMSFVMKPCSTPWAKHRRDHLPSLALIRKGVFVNDQWDVKGSQLIRVKYLEGTDWSNDPSQLTTDFKCSRAWLPMTYAVKNFPRDKFDYLWIIGKPDTLKLDEGGLQVIWRSQGDTLYKIVGPVGKAP